MIKDQPKSYFFRRPLHRFTHCEDYGFLWEIETMTDTYNIRRNLNDGLDCIFQEAFEEYDELVQELSNVIDLPLYNLMD